MTASANPQFGASITIDNGNSLGITTPGLLLVGVSPASIPTNAGGTILVDVSLLVPLVIDSAGKSISATIPRDDSLCGVSIFLQSIELDSGAQRRLSFTPGLDLVIGV